MPKFLTGVNQGWFSNAYGGDLGRNQFSGAQLWHWPHTDPVTFDFTRPDPSPPAPLVSQQPQLVDQYFQLIQGVDVSRIWLFEKLEGILFDSSNNNKKVVGIDAELLSNLHRVLDSAQSHGVKVYLCLFDAWAVKHQPPQGLPTARLAHYDDLNRTIREIMKSIVESPSDFVSSVLEPLVSSIAGHPAVYAVDVMNEPEGMIVDTHVVSNAAMRGYIAACCQATRPHFKTSVGCMKSSTARGYSDLPVDFSDFHSYGKSPPSLLFSYSPSGYGGKPCIVGECGYPVSKANSAAREVQAAQEYVRKAHEKGYSACLVWNRDFTSEANNASIVQWLVQFAAGNRQVATNVPPPSPFAAFAAWLLGLFGL
jgi:hypothetical protein